MKRRYGTVSLALVLSVLMAVMAGVMVVRVSDAITFNPTSTASVSDPAAAANADVSTQTNGERTVSLYAGWNDACYSGPAQPTEGAVADIADHVLTIYRLTPDRGWESWIPGHPDISTITTSNPYDQFFIEVDTDVQWLQEVTPPPAGPPELIQGWNSVCYTGPVLPVEEATADWPEFAALYMLDNESKAFCRYVPDRPDISNCGELRTFDSVLVLVGEAPDLCGPIIPGTYSGAVTIDGEPAPDGFVTTAVLDGTTWATTTTSGGRYAMHVPERLPVQPPCFWGGHITFLGDGMVAQESGMAWSPGLHDLDLTFGTTATSTPTPTPTPTPTATPTPGLPEGFHAHYACRQKETGELRDTGVDAGQQAPRCPGGWHLIQLLVKH